MKKLLLTTGMLFLLVFAYCNNNTYENAMLNNLKAYNAAKTVEELQDVANKFVTIAMAEKDKWLPYYYAADVYINMSFRSNDGNTKDQLLDQAQKYLDEAIKLQPNESENYVLQGYLYQGRIQVDPMTRGQQYVMKANESFGHAKAIDPENPRIYFLQGMNIFGTPEAFGGGAKNAKPLFQIASEKFAKFTPVDSIHPDWGKEINEKMLKQCEN